MGIFTKRTETHQAQGDTNIRVVPAFDIGVPKNPLFDVRKFGEEGFRRNVVVFACIKEIATSVSEAQLVVNKGEDLSAPNSPINRVLRRPNERQSLTAFLMELMVHKKVAGNAFVQKRRAGRGNVTGLRLLRPDRMKPIPAADGQIQSFEHTVSGKPQRIDADDVVHIKDNPDPLDDYWGLSSIAVLARYGDLDNSAADYLRAYFLNAGTPQALLTMKEQVGSDERERIKVAWRDQYQGTKGWHSVAVLDADASYQKIGSTPNELDLRHIFAETESRICSAFGVPPILVGAWIGLLRSTFANYETARRSFWQETLMPEYMMLADELTHGIASEFGNDLTVEFDLSEVQALKKDEEVERRFALDAWISGGWTRNEFRVETGKEEVRDGNVFREDPRFIQAPAEEENRIAGSTSLALPSNGGQEKHFDFIDDPSGDPEWRLIHRAADDQFPQIRDSVISSLEAMGESIVVDDLIKAIEDKDLNRIEELVSTQISDEDRELIQVAIQEAFVSAGKAAERFL